MKKVLSVFIAAVMLFTLSFGAAMFVSADGEPTIVVSSQSAARGETKDVTISLKNNPGVATMKIKVAFPSDLSLVSSGSGSHNGNYIPDLGDTEYETTDFDNWVDYNIAKVRGTAFQPETAASPVTLNWVCLSDLSEDVIFATLKFKVDDAAEFGDKDITVTYENGDISDINENDVNFSIQNGKITVVCTHNFTETVNNEYLKTPASCTQKAVYYKSCSVCGEKSDETFESGDFLAHTLGAWESDSTSHWKTCSSCSGQFESANHTESDWIIDTPATVGNDGQKHKECTVCGRVLATETIPALLQPKIVAESKTARAGDTVEINVGIANNPGIVSFRLKVEYDTDALELLSVQNTGLLSGYTTPSPTISSPYTLRWADSLATENNFSNGNIATLTFKVKDGTETGDYDISVDLIESRNQTGSTLDFSSAKSTVSVITFIPGDADGDGEISDWDAIVLERYLAGWGVEINEPAADVDGDGEISDWDAIVLQRYLAGWGELEDLI